MRGVWGEVYFAVQMSAKGDCVTLLEPDAEKQASSSFLFEEHVLYMSLNGHRHLLEPGVGVVGKQVLYSVCLASAYCCRCVLILLHVMCVSSYCYISSASSYY